MILHARLYAMLRLKAANVVKKQSGFVLGDPKNKGWKRSLQPLCMYKIYLNIFQIYIKN